MKETSALKWLRTHNFRITRVRQAIVTNLLETRTPLTLAELHLRIGTGDFATVFRFLDSAAKRKLVRIHTWDDRQVRYELVDSEQSHHHHHLVCRECRKVQEIDTCVLESWQKELARKSGYADIDHCLELIGTCPACQKLFRPAKPVRAARPSTS